VLLATRLAGVAPIEEVARRAGTSVPDCRSYLDRALAASLVQHREGVLVGWSVTSAGRTAAADWARQELARSGAQVRFEALYERFVPLNRAVLAVCSDWQVRSDGDLAVRNDHDDAEYDSQVLARFAALAERASALIGLLAGVIERFGAYSIRLNIAAGHVLSGSTEWLTRPTLDSYHSVWFELHEDLLCSIGRTRNDEASGAATG
jgi:hypothetical protein